MCGFLGCIDGDLALARAMKSLSHRGPDAEDEVELGNLYLRHFRLAIIGAESVAHQPMWSSDGRVILVFNGEIYNYKELAQWMGRPELAAEGDTRVLIEFLSVHGLQRIELLNGMFTFAAYFEDTQDLYLVRDRFGIKPLYYLRGQDGLYFASEIKSLRHLTSNSPSRQRLMGYLDSGAYPHGVNTIYDDILQLDAGTWLRYRKGELETRRWYDLATEVESMRQQALSVDGYEELLQDSIKLRLRSDVPVSLHYSAGTDSTALLLKVKESWGWDFPLATFTMAFDESDADESRIAKFYCEQIGVKNHQTYLRAYEVPALAEELHNFMDEPYGGVPTIAYYRMNQIEREMGYIVSIEGQGGDEAFGGYLYHVYMAIHDLQASGQDPALLDLILKVHKLELEDALQDAQALIEAGFRAHTDMTDLRSHQGEAPEKFIDWLRTIQLYDVLINKIPRTLRFNDRASMACGREVRFPLLDHRVLEYALAFDHAVKYQGGNPKAPLREIIRRHMPGAYDVPKRSVVTPQTRWLQHELKAWAMDRIGLLRGTGIIPDRYFGTVDKFYSDPQPGNSFPLWQLINLSYFINDF